VSLPRGFTLIELPVVRKRRISAFTLIELLIVIAVISLLVSIMLPSLSNAKRSAQRTVCASNLRQINLSMNYYLEDHERTYPCAQDPVSTAPFYWLWMGRGWRGFLEPYIEVGINQDNPSILFCPGDPATKEKYEATSFAYSMSFYHTPEQIDSMSEPKDTYSNPLPSVAHSDEDVTDPHGKIMIGEWTSNHHPIDPDGGWWTWEGKRNFLLADGSVTYLPAADLAPANDAFPDPNLTVHGIEGSDLAK